MYEYKFDIFSVITGRESMDIHLGELQCAGQEARLVDCPRGQTSDCLHDDDAGVLCLRTGVFIIYAFHN